jgi:hypothetical protein
MTTDRKKRPRALTAQIEYAEQQVLLHQRGIVVRTAGLNRKINQQLTAPASLMLASGIGFILGEITKCQRPKLPKSGNNSAVAETSPLNTALKLLISAHSLYTALPLAWIIKSLQKSDATSQTPQRKSRPIKALKKAPIP